MRFSTVTNCRTLPELLRFRAELHPTRVAALFVGDDGNESTLTYAALWQRSVEVATTLGQLGLAGDTATPTSAPRAMLVFPPGLDFLPAFLGSQLAGWIPVPTCYPKPLRPLPRVNSVARDCTPSVLLSTNQTISTIDKRHLDSGVASLPMVAVDALGSCGRSVTGEVQSSVSTDSIALLQYTSGSTSEPKGVIVSQRNVMANIASIAGSFQIEADNTSAATAPTAASWLPFFHDMGLIGGLLAPLYLGYRAVFISPQSFVQRPIRWLKLITDYQAAVSGGPNFAYELSADRVAPSQMASLDLSSWRVAFCGAEPIRARTLHTFAQRFSSAGFSESSFYPCYGLAESTLLAAGGAGPALPTVIEIDRAALRQSQVEESVGRSKRDSVSLVACGIPTSGTTLKIVNPESLVELPSRSIGEIWLHGDSITSGYWQRPEENESRFGMLNASPKSRLLSRWFHRGAELHSQSVGTSTDQYFRTGDLGFVVDGMLYVTGRIKDIVIVRGRNYAPQDIEASVQNVGLPVQGRTVAISVEGPRAEGLAIIAEIARDTQPADHIEAVRDIRRAIIDEHEIDPRLVLLVRPGTIPVTTSGKVQRAACRAAISDGKLEVRYRWERSGGAESPPLAIPELPSPALPSDRDEIEVLVRDWLGQWLIARVGIDPLEIDVRRKFDDYGLDSLTAVELSGELADWSSVELTPTNAWEHPTIESMAELVADGLIGSAPEVVASIELVP